MVDISRHKLIHQAYDVCQAIEMCGASVELTNAVTKASALMLDLDKFIPTHSAEDAFQHFLSYSGNSGQTEEIKALMFKAFLAAYPA